LNRPAFAALALAFAALANPAVAQTAPPTPSVVRVPPPASCAECGVVRSVKRVEKAQQITAQERKSTAGFEASLPIGGGKPTVGSSTDVRAELNPPVVTYEVVVRLDDGRFQVVVQDDAESLREGDKVKIERGRVQLRER
jgi:hypothetical protein